ncbi:hypothetical protein NP493_41g02070 [Ridgeia piscesae]|nr:hypothetical protein NP493_41g02070 [Ridgeia piscesae]
MRKISFQSGTLRPTFVPSPEKPPWRQEYHRIETPVSQAVRARAFTRFNMIVQERNLYPFSNQMTSTQYKKPVTALYGPMLRDRVNGVNTQSNRHGFMPAQDFYF